MATFSMVFALAGAAPIKEPLFQVRLVEEHAGADTEPMTNQLWGADTARKQLRTVREVVQVRKVPLLNLSAVASAAVGEDPLSGAAELRIRLTPNGQKLFARITRQNAGRRIGLVIDGLLVAAPRVSEEMVGSDIPIVVRSSEVELRELAARISDAARK